MSNRLISAELERSDSARFVALGGYNVGKGYSKVEKVLRWLFYGVILSCVPFLMAAGYEWYIGYEFELFRIEYVPGFVTITFSVAANTCGYATDIEREFVQGAKRVFKFLSAGSLCLCLLFYAWLLSSERSVPSVNTGNNIETATVEEIEVESDIETFVIDDLEPNELAMSVREDRAIVIAKIVSALLLVNVIIGAILEYFSSDAVAPCKTQAGVSTSTDGDVKSE